MSNPKEQTLVNSKLTGKMEELMKKTLQVEREDEGLAYLQIKDQSYVKGTQIIFFRKRGTRLQSIAMGTVLRDEKNPKTNTLEMVIEIDKTSIVKYPQVGDVAVPLAEPSDKGDADKKDNKVLPSPVDEDPNAKKDQEGFLEFDFGKMFGTYGATYVAPSPSPAAGTESDRAKNVTNYSFTSMHFAYYSGFFPLGIEYDSHSGSFPTGNTFFRGSFVSQESVSTLSLNYKFKKLFHHTLGFIPRLVMLNDNYTTTNIDEGLLSTKTSGMGLGLRVVYEPKSPAWVRQKGEWFVQLQSLYAEYTYYPSITALDGTVSRGTSSTGSKGNQYRIGGGLMFWFDFIPVFKRWMLIGSYGARSYNLKFSGPTTINSNSFPIPAGGGSNESEKDYRILFGFRLEDPISLLTKKKDSVNK